MMRASHAFRTCDKDKSGNLDRNEFFRALMSLGFPLTNKEQTYALVDRDRSGRVSEREFVEFWVYAGF